MRDEKDQLSAYLVFIVIGPVSLFLVQAIHLAGPQVFYVGLFVKSILVLIVLYPMKKPSYLSIMKFAGGFLLSDLIYISSFHFVGAISSTFLLFFIYGLMISILLILLGTFFKKLSDIDRLAMKAYGISLLFYLLSLTALLWYSAYTHVHSGAIILL